MMHLAHTTQVQPLAIIPVGKSLLAKYEFPHRGKSVLSRVPFKVHDTPASYALISSNELPKLFRVFLTVPVAVGTGSHERCSGEYGGE